VDSLQVRAVAGDVGLATLRLKEAMAAIKEGKPLLVGGLEVRAHLWLLSSLLLSQMMGGEWGKGLGKPLLVGGLEVSCPFCLESTSLGGVLSNGWGHV